MTAQTLRVKNVTIPRDNDNIVIVDFSDGHRMTFVQHFVPMVTVLTKTLEAVWMEKDGKELVCFHSQHQYPVNRQPFGFVTLAAGWTSDRFAAYWQVALNHINQEQTKGRLKKEWLVLRCGNTDLREIKAAMWPSPRTSR